MLIRGRTDTFLHLLAIAQESGVDFTFDDFDRISREIPCRCKVSPSAHWVLAEDMHGTGDAIDVVIEAAERADKDPEYTSLDDAPSWVIVPEHHIDNRRMGGCSRRSSHRASCNVPILQRRAFGPFPALTGLDPAPYLRLPHQAINRRHRRIVIDHLAALDVDPGPDGAVSDDYVFDREAGCR